MQEKRAATAGCSIRPERIDAAGNKDRQRAFSPQGSARNAGGGALSQYPAIAAIIQSREAIITSSDTQRPAPHQPRSRDPDLLPAKDRQPVAEARPEPQDAISADMASRPLPPKPAGGRWPSPQEIQDLLADEGYSADDRKGWLKEVLTELETEHAARPSDDKRQLLDDIKSIADTYQSGKPVTDDVL